ncbi:hypothetical protein VKT23_001173 [Stygiomarasmius scandens]|uniref:Uncharacterized protein n=1 Tax=Marasmiellus scandens TaxID=2682957 RepID=A0ABR1K6B5_9AGAR
MSQPTKPAWNSSVRTRSSTTSGRPGQPGSSMSIKRKPVPPVDLLEPSTSSSASNTATTTGSASRTSRSRVSSMTSTASAKSSTSGHTHSTGNVNIPRPRVMSTSASSASLRSTLSASPKSISGSQLSTSPKSTSRSTTSARSASPGNVAASNPRLLRPATSPPNTSSLRPARSASNIRVDTAAASPMPSSKRLSSVSATSMGSNYSQKSFTGSDHNLSTSPEQVHRHNRPVDDPGGDKKVSDEAVAKEAEQKFDRSTIKSGYGSVFGFGKTANSDGKLRLLC